ncbi:MAG: ABC transporter permease [Bacteroidota bacterium]
MFSVLRAEARKLKNTTVGYLVPGILFLLLASIFLAHTLDVHRLSELGRDPWPAYLRRVITTYSMLFISPVCVLLVVGLLDLEKRTDAWTRLYVLPVSRGAIYWGKLLLIIGLVTVLTVLFALGVLLIGATLAWFYPEYELMYYKPDFMLLADAVLRGVLSSLGIIGLQYLVGLGSRGSLPGLLLGLIGMIAGFVLSTTDLSIVYLFPYSYPLIVQDFGPFAVGHGSSSLFSWSTGLLGSIAWCGVCACGGYWLELRRQVY